MSKELDTAIHAARQAGALLRQRYGADLDIEYKGPTDLVTEVDRQAEALIASIMQQAFPDYGFLGEETGGTPAAGQPYWVVDPIDGTTNYAHSYPLFCVSIALEQDGQPLLGTVYNPLLDELFWAERGQGAYLNGQRIRVSAAAELGQSLLATGFPYDVWTADDDNSRAWATLLKRASSLRCDGSAALDLCHVAAGRLDGYWELGLKPWDVAAGALIVAEAGGTITQMDGSPFRSRQPTVAATNGLIHDELIAVLQDREAAG